MFCISSLGADISTSKHLLRHVCFVLRNINPQRDGMDVETSWEAVFKCYGRRGMSTLSRGIPCCLLIKFSANENWCLVLLFSYSC